MNDGVKQKQTEKDFLEVNDKQIKLLWSDVISSGSNCIFEKWYELCALERLKLWEKLTEWVAKCVSHYFNWNTKRAQDKTRSQISEKSSNN